MKEEIAVAYDSGELSVPCVKLQCVDFDEELYAGLLAFRPAQKARLVKRNRDEDHESNAHSPKNRRAVKRVAQ